jgi:hypothetical protein
MAKTNRVWSEEKHKIRQVKKNAAVKRKRATDPDFREHKREMDCKRAARMRDKRANDPDFLAKEQAAYLRYYTKHKERLSKRRKELKYGLTPEDYDALVAAQNGCCAICGIGKEHTRYGLVIDHCHTTGKIRGLLCDNCNRGIGLFKDNTISLKSAINYLERNK